MPDTPLDNLRHHAQAHVDTRQALWDQIDAAVEEAHAELERERAEQDMTHPERNDPTR